MEEQQKNKKTQAFFVKNARQILLGAIVVAVLAQFIRPDRTNPSADPALSFRSYPGVPAGVRQRIEGSCFDCHSNETRWPWYSSITPVNFLIANDVKNARARMNFSEWRKHKPGKLQSLLEEIYDQVYNKEMPMKRYTLLHPDAALADIDVKMICDWASAEQERLANGEEAAADSSLVK